jgi:hypothetical protein
MSQSGIISISSGGGAVTSITGTAPITANGVSGTPETGAVTVAATLATTSAVGVASFNSADFTVNGSGQVSLTGGAVITVDADSGSATPSSGTITISGGSTGLTTTASGSTVDVTGTLNVAHGGTGDASFTAYAPVCGGTTTTGALQSAATGIGTSGYVLTSTGSSSLPSWQAAAGGGITTIDGNSGSVTGSTVHITTGTSNTQGTALFTGSSATLTLTFTSTNGRENTGIGHNCITSPGTSDFLTGFGSGALQNATTGTNSVCAFGYQALNALSGSGASSMDAFGANVLQSYQGQGNQAAFGGGTFSSLTGDNTGNGSNSAFGSDTANNLLTGEFGCYFGFNAGGNYSGSESSNICIGYRAAGTTGENNVLRIGNGTGTGNGNLNASYISGITGIGVTGSAVLVSSSNQLGVVVSSARFKDQIAPMGDLSEVIYKLKPSQFVYRQCPEEGIQTGLIAEEVNEVAPQLVCLDREGLPLTVKYHELASLLLNEIQKLNKRIEFLEAR